MASPPHPWWRREKVVITVAIAAATIAAVVAATVTLSSRGSEGSASPSTPASDTSTAAASPPAPGPPPTAAPPPASPAAGLAGDFQQFAAGLNARVGVVVAAVGDALPPVTLGEWQRGPAWSTIKAPLSIAALRESQSAVPTDAMRAAITESDNAAADQVWQSLGAPDLAAKKVEAVLNDAGAPATVPAQRPRPEFSAFGQTDWSLADQVKFLSWAKCTAVAEPILSLMGQVEGDQHWGLGGVEGAQIKGGWGPSPGGAYLVRQIAVIPTPGGLTAVAMAAEPSSGSFGDGTQVLTKLANWLSEHKADLPGGQCHTATTPP
jgi:hypothetical protein